MKRALLGGTVTVLAAAGLWIAQGLVAERIEAASVMAPRFEVDPFWPKPLPNDWLLGSVIGISIDSRDHVFITHRPQSLSENLEIAASTTPPRALCCQPAPNILEFDPEGNLVNSWGGPGEGYDWPESNHGITVDHEDNVWIGGNGRNDAHILKFTRDGDFIAQYGTPGAPVDSSSTAHFGRVAEVSVDADRNIAYVADGYSHKRVAVLDASTGEFLRYWGAYGNEPSDEDMGRYDPAAEPAQQFRNPVHCAQPSNDGLVYVCDRVNDRIQVFTPEGEFVTEAFVAEETLGAGSVWDLDFSKDEDQTWIYLVDGQNHRVYVLLRETLELITTFGAGGRQPGQFFGVHSVAVDSKGNLYTTETYEGKRLQRFVYQGLAPVTASEQGTPWPAAEL
jgi:DNA-binding beta-propeller fold protein YncE